MKLNTTQQKIVELLGTGDSTIYDLAPVLGVTPNAVWMNMNKLKKAGYVRIVKDGVHKSPTIWGVCPDALDKEPQSEEDMTISQLEQMALNILDQMEFFVEQLQKNRKVLAKVESLKEPLK